ncbi:hypothetical protein M3Y99_00934600 [Aphelenchoides fujianensis]|nr:hypothetical protein M3Y99_00934600 [Aphelenchoides fujianensis]
MKPETLKTDRRLNVSSPSTRSINGGSFWCGGNLQSASLAAGVVCGVLLCLQAAHLGWTAWHDDGFTWPQYVAAAFYLSFLFLALPPLFVGVCRSKAAWLVPFLVYAFVVFVKAMVGVANNVMQLSFLLVDYQGALATRSGSKAEDARRCFELLAVQTTVAFVFAAAFIVVNRCRQQIKRKMSFNVQSIPVSPSDV